MTVRQAYKLTLVELACIRNRATCNHQCKDCPCFCDLNLLKKALEFDVALLKAKDPMLYLADDLTELKEVLKNYVEGENQET